MLFIPYRKDNEIRGSFNLQPLEKERNTFKEETHFLKETLRKCVTYQKLPSFIHQFCTHCSAKDKQRHVIPSRLENVWKNNFTWGSPLKDFTKQQKQIFVCRAFSNIQGLVRNLLQKIQHTVRYYTSQSQSLLFSTEQCNAIDWFL